jgi:uncharacterized protein with HEPN domain
MKVEDDIIRKYLEDIRTSIDAIDIHLGKRPSFKKYLKNLTMRRAVEREFEIIGEATVRILKIDLILIFHIQNASSTFAILI